MTTMKTYVLLPEDEIQESRPKSNGKRKMMILTSAGVAAIVGLGATNVVSALNASAADAAHHHQIAAMRVAHERQIHQIKTQDGILLTNTIDQLKTHEHRALRAMKIADRKAARKAAHVAYTSGQSAGYSTGYGAGNSAGYTSGYSSGNSAGYSSGYSSGNSDGYGSGYSTGSADGYSQGFNNGVTSAPAQQCSNDPNVTWLPYCSD